MTSQNSPPTPTPSSGASEGKPSPGPSEAASENSARDRRRNVDPPKNADGKLYCDHTDCKDKNAIFDLKCQWNKHMDKHERPYICKAVGCEKLKGFTYAGGLLRHEREVHKMHGGALFMCPVPYCKRNTALGFARKENLKEHMRRTHYNTGELSEPLATSPEATSPETPSGFSAINARSHTPPLRKRRRTVSSTSTVLLKNEAADDDNIEDSGDEMRRLRKDKARLQADLSARDEKIKALEATVSNLERTTSLLERTISFLSQPQRARIETT